MIRQRQAFCAGLFNVLTYYNICGYIILQMNRKSVKGCMTTNIKKLKKKPARSLQEKGRTQETTE